MVYVSYHIFEHYSSVRNLAGPHKGPPRIKEVGLDVGAYGDLADQLTFVRRPG